MDPSRNLALHNAKLQALTMSGSPTAPPSYHTVVDPNAPIPNLGNPYDHDADVDEDDSIPEININAATQIRGHANIITIAPLDSAQIASILQGMLHTEDTEEAPQSAPAPEATTTRPAANARRPKAYPKMNITINCGATVVGDRNIVGPGLGNISKQLQVAHARQSSSQTASPDTPHTQTASQTQGRAHTSPQTRIQTLSLPSLPPSLNTPPMSRSPSTDAGSAVGAKRKSSTDDDVADRSKRSRTDAEANL